MTPNYSPASNGARDEISELIETLNTTEQRLEELTGGEVDAVSDSQGHTFLLRRAQEQSRHAEAKKQAAILNALPAHIALLNQEGVIVSVNEAWRQFATANRLQGPDYGLGVNYLEVCDRARGAFSAEAREVGVGIRAVLDGTRKSYTIEYPCHSPTEQRWFLLTVTPLAEDRPSGAVVMHLNITERRCADDKIKRLAAIVDSSADAIISKSTDGLISSWNPAAETLFGYSAAEIVGRPMKVLIPPELSFEEVNVLAGFAPGELVRNLESIRVRKNGDRVDVSITISPIKNPEGDVVGVSKIIRDITERKQREAEVRFNAQRYRLLVEATTAIVWDTPASGEFEVEQPGWSAFTGQNFKEYRGWGWLKAIHPDDQRETAKVWSAAIESRSTYEVEHRVRARDGTYRNMMVRAVPILADDGSIRQWIGIHTDITEQRRIEQELKEAKVAAVVRENTQRYNFLADSVPLIIWTARPDGNLDYYNKAWFEYTGLTLEQTKDWGWGAVVHPDDLKLCVERWTRSFTTGKPYEIEYRFKRVNGDYRWFLGRATARRGDNGEIVQWVGTGTDIDGHKRAEAALRRTQTGLESKVADRTTELSKSNAALREENAERKRAETALQRQQDELRVLFDMIPAMIWFKDTENRILRVNKRVAESAGKSVEEIEGKPSVEIYPNDAARFYADDLEVMQSGVPKLEYVETLRNNTGDEHWVQTDKVPVRDAEGKVVGIVVMAQDITERKRTEAALHSSEIQLRQSAKMEAIGQLAGGIAHDFNNLLTVIIGRAQLLESRKDMTAPILRSVNLIHKTGLRAAVLTRQLLQFSRQQVLQPQIIDLNILVPEMQEMLRSLISEDIDLVIKLSKIGKINADPGQVQQVVMNLVVNARDAMPKGGKITIETSNIHLDEEYCANNGDSTVGPYVMLAVADTGCGMDEKIRARIFDPFFTTKEQGKGTGLGLSTVYGIVKQAGGSIYVYSEVSHGTVFKVYFPEVAGKVHSGGSSAVHSSIVGGGETILLVEDEEGIRELLSEILTSLGYTVLMAMDGEQAIRCSEDHKGKIQLLLTDVVMPKLNGKEVALRLHPVRPEMKVLYMSGYTNHSIVSRGVLDAGIEFLEKPLSPTSVAAKVREVLDRQ